LAAERAGRRDFLRVLFAKGDTGRHRHLSY
jgi:hypothetical protein